MNWLIPLTRGHPSWKVTKRMASQERFHCILCVAECWQSMEHFEDIGPSVVMASPGMMQSGLSRELFESWCTDKRNGVIIAGYCVEGTLAKVWQFVDLFTAWINTLELKKKELIGSLLQNVFMFKNSLHYFGETFNQGEWTWHYFFEMIL